MDARRVYWWLLGGAALLWVLSRTTTGEDVIRRTIDRAARIPRGIRNHNPGNIERTGTRWRGMAEDQSADPRFIVFEAPIWGLRAIARVLRTYRRQGHTTIRAIINRWAPPIENPTAAYIDAVAREVGIGPDVPVPEERVQALMQAIVRFENGTQPYDPALFAQAIALERQA